MLTQAVVEFVNYLTATLAVCGLFLMLSQRSCNFWGYSTKETEFLRFPPDHHLGGYPTQACFEAYHRNNFTQQ